METTLSTKTIKAHQKHHGAGEMSELILQKRIEAGWTPAEIAYNCKPLTRAAALGYTDVEDANGTPMMMDRVRRMNGGPR